MNNENPKQGHTQIRGLFDKLAPRYDLMNNLFSLGIHRYWKERLVNNHKVPSTQCALDICTGTGEIGIRYALRNPSARVVGLDASHPMLIHARHKIQTKKLTHRFELIQGNGLQMPFKNDYFDVVFNSFGLRNEENFLQAFCEMARTLKPGGRVYILEFSFPTHPLLRPFYQIYLSKIMPWTSQFFLKERHSFDYLSRTVQQFPSRTEIVELMRQAGFNNIQVHPLTGGIVSIYQGICHADKKM